MNKNWRGIIYENKSSITRVDRIINFNVAIVFHDIATGSNLAGASYKLAAVVVVDIAEIIKVHKPNNWCAQ